MTHATQVMFGVAVALGLASALVRRAEACSVGVGKDDVVACPPGSVAQTTMPGNAVFRASCVDPDASTCAPPWDGEGAPALWRRVDLPVPGAWFALDAPRPQSLAGADAFPYAARVLLGPDDTAPPPAPEASFEIDLVRDPSSGGGFGCPDVDQVVLRMQSTDARPFFGAFFFGASEDEASSVSRAEVVTAVCREADGTGVVHANVGQSIDRQRGDYGGFTRRGRFCFTAAWMTVTGGLGPRTPPQCLNTQDEKDPHAVFVAGDGGHVGCLCAARPSDGPATLAMALGLGAVAALCARRRALASHRHRR
jgi:hypothetical protein